MKKVARPFKKEKYAFYRKREGGNGGGGRKKKTRNFQDRKSTGDRCVKGTSL